MNTYEYTKFSNQMKAAPTSLRIQIKSKIASMKQGHFSNEKSVSNGENVLKTAGVHRIVLANKPKVREIRVTQDVRIFFFESENKEKKNHLSLVCLGHMKGNNVQLNP